MGDDPSMPGSPPRDRPRYIREPAGRGSPWVTMTQADADARIRATQAAWRAYQASIPKDPGQRAPVVLDGENGSRWKIDAGGNIVPA